MSLHDPQKSRQVARLILEECPIINLPVCEQFVNRPWIVSENVSKAITVRIIDNIWRTY